MKSSLVARPLAAAAAVVMCTLVVAACGNSTKTAAPPSTTSTTTAGRGAALAAFRSCMQSHGVTLPANFRPGGAGRRSTTSSTPGGTVATTTLPPGVTGPQYQSALQACASTLGAGRGVNSAALAAYRNCLNAYLMSNGGTTIPSTGGFGGFGGFGGGAASGNTTTTNPMLQAAMAHCQALRPSFPGRGTTTSTTA